MKYYKSKCGYFYKEYGNGKKKRISLKDYKKFRKNDTKIGGSNPSLSQAEQNLINHHTVKHQIAKQVAEEMAIKEQIAINQQIANNHKLALQFPTNQSRINQVANNRKLALQIARNNGIPPNNGMPPNNGIPPNNGMPNQLPQSQMPQNQLPQNQLPQNQLPQSQRVRASVSVNNGNKLCIMRHSLRLDNELREINKVLLEQQVYYQKEIYNTPLANRRYTKPREMSIFNQADDRIQESMSVLKETGFKFGCIVTSPFTRCLQTTALVQKILNITSNNIFIDYNLREVDQALDQYPIIKKKYPTTKLKKIFNTNALYDKKLISSLGYRIDKYKKQSVNDIFNAKKKNFGNVLLITHGDIFNYYIQQIYMGNEGLGKGRLDEAGWGIFDCNNGICPPEGTALTIANHFYEKFFD
jgi:broad specificity phosphatase PhoE